MSQSLENSAFSVLEQQGRLLSPVFRGTIPSSGRAGFRGELAIRFAQNVADEARPPELLAQQVITTSEGSSRRIDFFSCYLLSFGYLEPLAEAIGDTLSPTGKHFIFCNNIDLSRRYQMEYQGIPFHILPLDESTVYNELLDLFRIERNDLKKLDTANKIDRLATGAASFTDPFPPIAYADCLAGMGPVRDPGENRPV